MFGSSAAIDDSGGVQNSALKGITSIGASGELDLEDAASLTTTGALTNTGYLYLDDDYADGGSTLSVGKKITNEGTAGDRRAQRRSFREFVHHHDRSQQHWRADRPRGQ